MTDKQFKVLIKAILCAGQLLPEADYVEKVASALIKGKDWNNEEEI